MLDCLIIGDSIAVGTKMFAPTHCVSYAHGGWNTWQWNNAYLDKGFDLSAETVVISLGTNDHRYIKTEDELRKMRTEVNGKNVIWIVPPCNEVFCKPDVTRTVYKIAREFGDMTIQTNHLQQDHIHPNANGYKELVKEANLK
jgi:hypothetical protein